MGKKKIMVPAEQLDPSTVKYEQEPIQAPHLTGFSFKMFVQMAEAPVIGSLIISTLKKQNKMTELLRNTMIPEAPMLKPEYPPQGMKIRVNMLLRVQPLLSVAMFDPELEVVVVDEAANPENRVELALRCLPEYDPATLWSAELPQSFCYWKIWDYAHAYRSELVTPSEALRCQSWMGSSWQSRMTLIAIHIHLRVQRNGCMRFAL